MPERYVSLFGYFVLIGFAWLLSNNHRKFPWRVVIVGSVIQVILAGLILKTTPGAYLFDQASTFFTAILSFSDAGAEFVFGSNFKEHFFAFKVLPTIIFVSALATILYYLGVMQLVVQVFAVLMQRLMGLSGAESLAASANIFMGQTEAPLLVKPFISGMTNSELFAVMVGGFANISVSLLAVYSGMGVDVGHLLTSSVISAPASLLLAKVMIPETQIPATLGRVDMEPPKVGSNLIEAAAIGAKDGLYLALNVAAMLIVFIALIKMCDVCLYQIGIRVNPEYDWSLQYLLGYVFIPLAWLMGVPMQDCQAAGQLLGIKLVATEFIAYEQLGHWINDAESPVRLRPRTVMLMTYALCGFSNFASIGIQIGGLGGMAPERQGDIARLGFRAMIGGMLATCMTACVAGVPEAAMSELDHKMSESVFDRLRVMLEGKVPYEVLHHAPVFTSEEAAAIRGVPLASGAKALICRLDERFVMFVLPADRRLASKPVRKLLSARSMRFATTKEVWELTALRPGSIPPFGSLFGLATYCERRLSEQPRINFNAGDHAISVSLTYEDYIRVEQPALGEWSE